MEIYFQIIKVIMMNYFQENEVIPNLLNKSITLAIKKHFNGRNVIEEEIILAKVNEISLSAAPGK